LLFSGCLQFREDCRKINKVTLVTGSRNMQGVIK
jgi:hypothetical protein